MKTKHISKLGSLAAITFFFSALEVRAQILFSHEEDPIPLVNIQAILPLGTESLPRDLIAAGSAIDDIFESGTQELARQDYLEALAAFGAASGFSMGAEFSYWDLSFPYIEGKDYAPLIELLKENWKNPRLNEESFSIAKTKLVAGISTSLENDWSVVGGSTRRWSSVKHLGAQPLFLEMAEKLKIEDLRTLISGHIHGQERLWAGFVGPNSLKSMAQKIVSDIFEIKEIQTRFPLGPIKERDVAAKEDLEPQKDFLIIDKADRSQNITMLFSLRPQRITAREELSMRFANFVLTGSGLGSVWGNALRNEGGFAYSVGSIGNSHLGYPLLGFASNPLHEKLNEAFASVAELKGRSFVSASIFDELHEDDWQRHWRSFRYNRILGRNSASDRLSELAAVMQGVTSYEHYSSDATAWVLSRQQAIDYVSKHWANSHRVFSIMGDVDELKALHEKSFSDYKLHVIPYLDSVKEGTYKN